MANLRVNKIAAVGVSTENTGSVFFDGSSDWLRARGGDNFNDFNFGSSDFTIEGFFYANDVNGTDIPIALAADTVSANSDAGWYIRYQSNKIEGQAFSSSNNIGITTSGTVSNNTWYHVAYVREGSTFTLYVDGVAVDTATSSSSLNWNSGWKVEIGSGYGGANYFAGYISNLRICKGHAVYKSNFAVPVRELDVHPGPDNDRTVLLACYDGENIFAEKTGRHILASQGNRTSSPTLAAGETPVGITTFQPGLTRSVDATAGPTFQGGVGFVSQNWLTLPKGTTTQRGRGRGVFGGGENPSQNNVIQFVNMSSQGTSQDFGDLVRTQMDMGATGSQTRGLFAGGDVTTAPLVDENTIQFITIATTGNAADFGDLTGRRKLVMGGGTNTRGVFGGGSEGSDHKNNIDYVTIASLGNAQDFGDLNRAPNQSERGASQVTGSPTRGIFYIRDNAISYITWATLGNALDFGDTINNSGGSGAVGDTTRSCMHGTIESYNNSIEYITISTLGNGQDFGDLTVAMRYQYGASNPTRGVMAGAADPALNNINFITIQTTGNAQDFGDLNTGQQRGIGLSDSHGGLG